MDKTKETKQIEAELRCFFASALIHYKKVTKEGLRAEPPTAEAAQYNYNSDIVVKHFTDALVLGVKQIIKLTR